MQAVNHRALNVAYLDGLLKWSVRVLCNCVALNDSPAITPDPEKLRAGLREGSTLDGTVNKISCGCKSLKLKGRVAC